MNLKIQSRNVWEGRKGEKGMEKYCNCIIIFKKTNQHEKTPQKSLVIVNNIDIYIFEQNYVINLTYDVGKTLLKLKNNFSLGKAKQ